MNLDKHVSSEDFVVVEQFSSFFFFFPKRTSASFQVPELYSRPGVQSQRKNGTFA